MTSTPRGNGAAAPLYLYAIVRGQRLGDAVRAVNCFRAGIRAIERGEFAAVVSDWTDGSLKGRSRETLVPLLLAHQEIIDRIMAFAPVLPVKFGTVAPDRQAVERCLEIGGGEFKAAFDRLDVRAQYEIVVTWDLDTAFREIAEEEAVVQLKAVLPAAGESPGRDGRVELGQLVKQSLERRREELGARLSRALQAVAIDSVANPLMDDRMVLNQALLVRADHTEALDRCIEALDAEAGGRLVFRCVGPLPPYSFATVEVTFLDKEAIERARCELQLERVRSTEDVQSAYRRRAKRVHPDLTGTAEADDRAMALLNDAYKTLWAYAEAGGPVIVSVRRQALV